MKRRGLNVQKVKEEESIKWKKREKVWERDEMIYMTQTALKLHKLFCTI